MVKEDFPILQDIVYLDNAATTQKPLQVIDAIRNYYLLHNANIHRGVYPLARKSTDLYEEAHRVVADFIGARAEEVVFVRNTTEGLNLASHLLEPLVGVGNSIVVTISEHHSNLLPWWRLARRRRARLRIGMVREDGSIDEEDVISKIDESTKIVAVQHASNVTGHITDVRKIVKQAKKVGAVVVLDGAQSVPHIPIDVNGLGVDVLAFSGHKMLGPMGIGVLWARKEILEEAEPFLLGGDMIKEVHYTNGEIVPLWNELPWKFEAGTPNVAGAVGLMEAIRYLKRFGMEKILPHEKKLATATAEGLEDMGFNVIGGERRGGVVAFWKEGIDPHLLAYRLGQKKVCVRSGYHCAQPLHEVLGVRGSVRASFYLYNDEDDVERFFEALREVVR